MTEHKELLLKKMELENNIQRINYIKQSLVDDLKEINNKLDVSLWKDDSLPIS